MITTLYHHPRSQNILRPLLIISAVLFSSSLKASTENTNPTKNTSPNYFATPHTSRYLSPFSAADILYNTVSHKTNRDLLKEFSLPIEESLQNENDIFDFDDQQMLEINQNLNRQMQSDFLEEKNARKVVLEKEQQEMRRQHYLKEQQERKHQTLMKSILKLPKTAILKRPTRDDERNSVRNRLVVKKEESNAWIMFTVTAGIFIFLTLRCLLTPIKI